MRASLWTSAGLREAIARIADAFVLTRHIKDAAVTDAKLRNSAAASVIGRSADSAGAPADITASPLSGAALREDGAGGISFGTLATAGVADDAVTNAKLANMNSSQIKGRAVAAGVGDPTDLSAAQARAVLNVADGANNYVHPNHSGDVTSVADGAQTIAADAVTNAKLANMATATVKGRNTAGTGDPEDLTTIPTGTVPAFTGDVTTPGGSLATTIAAAAVTNAKQANMATQTIKARVSTGSGAPEDGTLAQVRLLLGVQNKNLLANSGFAFAQRQAPATLTTYSNTSGRTYGPDYWTITNENASVQFARVDARTTTVTGITSPFYAQLKKITAQGKIILAQVVEAEDLSSLRGRSVRVQVKARNNVGSATLRVGLLNLTSSGTIDTIPATFVSAFGAAATDPTWGTNLSAITPTQASSTCSVVGAGLTCTLTASFQLFGGTFIIPATCLNVIMVVYTDSRPATNDIFELAEAGIYDGTGSEDHDFAPESVQAEFARCQRRCYKTFNRDTAPAQNVGGNTGEHRAIGGAAGAVALRFGSIPFAVPMRAAPTITTYNPAAANAEVRNQTIIGDCSATTSGNTTERGTFVQMTGHASGAVGNLHGIHILAEDNL